VAPVPSRRWGGVGCSVAGVYEAEPTSVYCLDLNDCTADTKMVVQLLYCLSYARGGGKLLTECVLPKPSLCTRKLIVLILCGFISVL
jgi:hypothetical protein